MKITRKKTTKHVNRPKFSSASQLLLLLLNAWLGLGGIAHAEDAAQRGKYLATAAGCKSCHTDTENDGALYAGGHRLVTPYGDFYTPNITPDKRTGIGAWSEAEFIAALREGVSPGGEHYYPSFPYASYAGMTRQDATDIKAYLDTLEPLQQANRTNDLVWYVPGRWAMGIWQSLFAPWEYAPAAADASEEWQRGAYLVRHLGHCGECHTPRDRFGALNTARELAGNKVEKPAESAPDITTDKNTGIGSWSAEDLEFFLELGMYPDGDFVGGGMAEVVDDNTALLTAADRRAIRVFLQSLK
jgi:mono/diheme cytochrome c family protein